MTFDATKDADINKKKAEIEKIEDEINRPNDGIKAKLNTATGKDDAREIKKLTSSLTAKEKIVEDKKKPLVMDTSAIGKYKQGLLYQIAVIDDEIIKIIENDNNMKYTRFKVDNNDIYLTGGKIISNYNSQLNEFLQFLQERASARATATARAPTARAPTASAPAASASAPPPLMFIGGGKFDEKKKELIFSQKIDNILNSFSGDIKEVLDAIAAPLDNKDKLEEYINELYKLSPKKSKNLDCSTKVSVDDYVVMGIKHTGAKVDYNSYMNTTIEQFNIAILKLKEPSLSAKDFYKKIEENLLLNKNWWKLISYNTTTRDIYDELNKINDLISEQLVKIEQKEGLTEREPGEKKVEEDRLKDYNIIKDEIEKEIANKLFNFLTTYSEYNKVEGDEPHEDWKAEKNKEMNNTKKLWGSFAGIVNRVMQSKRFGETWRKRARQGTSVGPTQRRPSVAPTQRRPATQAPPSRQSKVTELRKKQSLARSRKVSSARRLEFDNLYEDASVGGGKRTRKYKNKRNKKTRQRHQKSRKNITIKKRKEKGKHRTPRHK